mgnify:CR=1 FL=1
MSNFLHLYQQNIVQFKGSTQTGCNFQSKTLIRFIQGKLYPFDWQVYKPCELGITINVVSTLHTLY